MMLSEKGLRSLSSDYYFACHREDYLAMMLFPLEGWHSSDFEKKKYMSPILKNYKVTILYSKVICALRG